ncbi:MAG: ribulose-phosphate 3-epimerase [Acidobacteria bacterium]|nr:ribulose-phosphate 3-epimerase [Acidobacteriota bacterium]
MNTAPDRPPRPDLRKRRLAPSLLSADFSRLAETLVFLEANGVEMVHLDVMDGHFVPNLSFGPPVIRSIRAATRLILDVHLMIEEPERWVGAYAAAGADMVSLHVEAARHLHRGVQAVRDAGLPAGVVLNPATPLCALDEILPGVDFVLLMSVNPGFGGQAFIPSAMGKVRALREKIRAAGLETAIEVDGGVCPDNIGDLAAAGVDIAVAGSAVFHAPDPKETLAVMTRSMLQ